MVAGDEYTIKYHHRGSLVREGGFKYNGGNVDKLGFNLHKLYYWNC